MKSILSCLAVFLYAAAAAETAGSGGGAANEAPETKGVLRSYPTAITEQRLSELPRATVHDFAVGLVYYVPRKVGYDADMKPMYVFSTRRITGSNLADEQITFMSDVNSGIAYLEGGPAATAQASTAEGGGADATSISNPKVVNENGVQNDGGTGGQEADNVYNRIQVEQSAHTESQTKGEVYPSGDQDSRQSSVAETEKPENLPDLGEKIPEDGEQKGNSAPAVDPPEKKPAAKEAPEPKAEKAAGSPGGGKGKKAKEAAPRKAARNK